MKRMSFGLLVTLLAVMLSGCLYPKEELAKNQVPFPDQVKSVQGAVEQFQKEKMILPIKTRDMKTPMYQKYPVDFDKLKGKYLSDVPGNAYENGGIFVYVLIDVETKPTVKLLDLRMAEAVKTLKMQLKLYMDAKGKFPFKAVVDRNLFTVDYKKLKLKTPPYAVSPVTNQNLPLVVDGRGEVYVDYRSDLYQLLKQYKGVPFKQGDDIRRLFTENSSFVPAYSLPYTVDEKGEPTSMVSQ